MSFSIEIPSNTLTCLNSESRAVRGDVSVPRHFKDRRVGCIYLTPHIFVKTENSHLKHISRWLALNKESWVVRCGACLKNKMDGFPHGYWKENERSKNPACWVWFEELVLHRTHFNIMMAFVAPFLSHQSPCVPYVLVGSFCLIAPATTVLISATF